MGLVPRSRIRSRLVGNGVHTKVGWAKVKRNWRNNLGRARTSLPSDRAGVSMRKGFIKGRSRRPLVSRNSCKGATMTRTWMVAGGAVLALGQGVFSAGRAGLDTET